MYKRGGGEKVFLAFKAMTVMIRYTEITTSKPLLMPSKDLFFCFSDGVQPFQIQIITSGFLSICHYEKKYSNFLLRDLGRPNIYYRLMGSRL